MQPAYLVDFDGTVTQSDHSSALAERWGNEAFQELERRYRRREVPIRAWLEEVVRLLPADLENLAAQALAEAEIRPGFHEFLDFAAQRKSPVVIASDGLGFYIEPILEKHGLDQGVTRIFRNETRPDPSGRGLVIATPHAHPTCPVCGNCKAMHVVSLQAQGYPVIYVGDGSNDRFGASWADAICARERLASSCREFSLPFTPWQDFFDVMKVPEPDRGDHHVRALCLPRGAGVRQEHLPRKEADSSS